MLFPDNLPQLEQQKNLEIIPKKLSIIQKIESKNKSKQSYGFENYSENEDKKTPISDKGDIEYDLIMTICGLEVNIIQLKKRIKSIRRGGPASHDIYSREIFINLNYLPRKAKTKDKSKETTASDSTNFSQILKQSPSVGLA